IRARRRAVTTPVRNIIGCTSQADAICCSSLGGAAFHATERSARNLALCLFGGGLSIVAMAGQRSCSPCSCTFWDQFGGSSLIHSFTLGPKLQLHDARTR